ncbi:MAG: methylmalonyl-CoA epimerase [bacterium]|nr:methylmalonyl-CoA epimerase [bacterium]
MLNKIDHIGIAVKDLESAIHFYQDTFRLKCKKIEEVPEQKVKTAMFPLGEIRIELLEATSPDSPIAKFISKRGEGIHHIAYRVGDIKSCLKSLKEKEIELIHEEPQQGTGNQLIAFIHPKSTFGVLSELCEGE